MRDCSRRATVLRPCRVESCCWLTRRLLRSAVLRASPRCPHTSSRIYRSAAPDRSHTCVLNSTFATDCALCTVAPSAALGDDRQYRCRVAIRVGRWLRYAAALRMCTTHFHLAATRETFFVPFPRLLDRSASNLPLGSLEYLVFSEHWPHKHVQENGQCHQSILLGYCRCCFCRYSEKDTIWISHLKRMFSFCFFPHSFRTCCPPPNYGCRCLFGRQSNRGGRSLNERQVRAWRLTFVMVAYFVLCLALLQTFKVLSFAVLTRRVIK